MSLQRGFARESLGEPSNFQVVASGSQHLCNFLFMVCDLENSYNFAFTLLPRRKIHVKTKIYSYSCSNLNCYLSKDNVGTSVLYFRY